LIGAIGFDLGGTLIEYEGVSLDWQRDYPAALAAVAGVWGKQLSENELAAGIKALRHFNTRISPRDREIDHTIVFASLLPALGLDSAGSPDSFEQSVDAFFSVFQHRIQAVFGAAELVETLDREGVPVGILTDVAYGMPRRLLLADLAATGLAHLADAMITSVEVGERKPSPAGFRLLVERAGVPVNHWLFVGDERKDVEGAKAAGMMAVLLWKGDGSAPLWGQDLAIANLQELRQIAAAS
jgi:putative hydrolase of the HAD superfamily